MLTEPWKWEERRCRGVDGEVWAAGRGGARGGGRSGGAPGSWTPRIVAWCSCEAGEGVSVTGAALVVSNHGSVASSPGGGPGPISALLGAAVEAKGSGKSLESWRS